MVQLLPTDEAPDLTWLPPNYQRAERLKASKRVKPYRIPGWTSDPDLQVKGFQYLSIAWLYLTRRAMLADQVGLGKTISILGLLQLLKSRGEPFRTIVICTKATQDQWYDAVRTFTDLVCAAPQGTKSERVPQYSSYWDILVTTYPLLLRDYPYLRGIEPDVVVLDESSTIRNHDIKTSFVVKSLTAEADRIYELDATPIQTSLLDLHSQFEALHMNIFGALPAFELRYVRREPTKQKRGTKVITTQRIVGYKNAKEFKNRIAPFILRRRAFDPEVEEHLPEVTVRDVFLDAPEDQALFYQQARKGAIRLFEEGQRTKARSSMHDVQRTLDTTLPYVDHPSKAKSVKLDYVLKELKNDLAGEKVVIFAKYKSTIRHAMALFKQHGIKALPYTGDRTQEEGRAAVDSFWNDPSMQVLIGTSALERGLNLQTSAFMICLNQLWNSQRMIQLVGRLRRIGSPHAKVIVINTFIDGTIETRLRKLQAERAAVSDYMLDDEGSELFESLSDEEIKDILRE